MSLEESETFQSLLLSLKETEMRLHVIVMNNIRGWLEFKPSNIKLMSEYLKSRERFLKSMDALEPNYS